MVGTPPAKVTRVAVVGLTRAPNDLGEGIEHKSVPDFIREICEELAKKDPMKEAVPETLPLLRAIQFAARYGFKLREPASSAKPAGEREPCLCGCGVYPKGRKSRYLPGHDAKVRRKARSGAGDHAGLVEG